MSAPGPVPNPNSRRQTTLAYTWTDLPASGYDGPLPNWPLPGTHTAAEREMWARYWRKPQAAAWAAVGMVDEVAMYIRAFIKGTKGDPRWVSEARQWVTPLGLTPRALLQNRWRIREVEVGESPAGKSGGGARRTLKVAE